MHSYRVFWSVVAIAAIGLGLLIFTHHTRAQQPQQRLVEHVDINGNKRLRKDDILYYIQTRPGDVYNAAQVQRDLQTLLGINFFDKTSGRVLISDGARGGVDVTFEVKELPIIRDIQFEGLK